MLQEVSHGQQINLIVLASTLDELGAFELDLVGVEHAVDEAGIGIGFELRCEVGEDLACPGFVVDAGWFVAEDDEVEAAVVEKVVQLLAPEQVALMGRAEFLWLHDDALVGGIGAAPVDVFPNIEGQVYNTVRG